MILSILTCEMNFFAHKYLGYDHNTEIASPIPGRSFESEICKKIGLLYDKLDNYLITVEQKPLNRLNIFNIKNKTWKKTLLRHVSQSLISWFCSFSTLATLHFLTVVRSRLCRYRGISWIYDVRYGFNGT